jgi:folate-binding protein YgfZ
MTDFADSTRAILSITGDDAMHFLQGILTQDVNKLREAHIQFAALLSPQGKILHDMFVIAGEALGLSAGTILFDTPALYKETLLKRLALYKLRAKVTIADVSAEWNIYYHASGLPDPRHTALPHRLYLPVGASIAADAISPEKYSAIRLSLGIPDSAVDFNPDELVALDAGYDLLNAVSFTKGCYVGQEVTARMHYKHIVRRGFYLLTRDDTPTRLALLKFEEVEAANHLVERDGITYHAILPEWQKPKWLQFKEASHA